jgi:hypothetical protein
LIDFEASVKFDPLSDKFDVTGVVGVPQFIPPESEATSEPYDGRAADVFSMGTLLTDFGLVSRLLSWLSHEVTLYKHGMHPAMAQLFAAMASDKPAERPSAASALARFEALVAGMHDAFLNEVPDIGESAKLRMGVAGIECPLEDIH